MKHDVVRKDYLEQAQKACIQAERVQHIDVILRSYAEKDSAEAVLEFYRALNKLLENHTYVVTLRVQAEDQVGGPLYWAGRTAIFWGDFDNIWHPTGAKKSWVSQVLNLSSRSLLVGGAVMLLAQSGSADRTVAAIHQSFEAAALESGLRNCGKATHFSADGRTHSANTRLSALRILAEFVSMDHGEYLADVLRRFIGLAEPNQKSGSQVANRLVRRAHGDKLVTVAVEKMLENIEDPLRITELSDLVGTSVRQLQRRFLCKTGAKLLETYKELRLERACSLLNYTELTDIEIASATGFTSRASMSRAYYKKFGLRPEQSRIRRYRGSISS